MINSDDIDKLVTENVVKTEKKVTHKSYKNIFLKFFLITVFLVLIFLGIIVNYFNDSKFVSDDEIVGNFSVYESKKIFSDSINGDSVELEMTKSQMNRWLISYVKKPTIKRLFGKYAEDLYYDEKSEFFVVDFSGPFIDTSLFFEVSLEKKEEDRYFKIVNPYLGNRMIAIDFAYIQKILSIPSQKIKLSNKIVKLEKFSCKNKLLVDADINVDFFENLGQAIKSENDLQYISYLTGIKKINLPAVYELIDKQLDLKEIIIDMVGNRNDIYNLLLLLDDKNRLNVANALKKTLILTNVDDIKKLDQKALEKKDILEANYIIFLKTEAEDALEYNLKLAYDRLQKMHQNAGVPFNLVTVCGRPYSSSLDMYITSEDLGLGSTFAHKFYGKEDSLVVGFENDDSFKYRELRTDGSISDVKTSEFKKLFLDELCYYNSDRLAVSDLNLDHEISKNILKAIRQELNLKEFPFVRTIRSDGEFAYVALSLRDNMQEIRQYLLMKNKDNWKILKVYKGNEEVEFCRDTSNKIHFNNRVLPTVKVHDFPIMVYSQDELMTIWRHLRHSGEISSDAELEFFSRVGDNLYFETKSGERVLIIFRADSKVLYEEIYHIPKNAKLSDYTMYLKPLKGFDNYYPDFVLLQD